MLRMLVNEMCEPRCVEISAGYFPMGCAAGRDDEQPVHRVWTGAFEMAVYQVRNRDWADFMKATNLPAPPEWTNPDLNHPDQPVVAVSWDEADQYCRWLSRLTSRTYRLPTEAEWEKAAQGGHEGALYPWGDEPPDAHDEYVRRWSGKVSGPLPVGQGTTNPFGLYDMGENVHEWCSDWYSRDYYAGSPERGPAFRRPFSMRITGFEWFATFRKPGSGKEVSHAGATPQRADPRVGYYCHRARQAPA